MPSSLTYIPLGVLGCLTINPHTCAEALHHEGRRLINAGIGLQLAFEAVHDPKKTFLCDLIEINQTALLVLQIGSQLVERARQMREAPAAPSAPTET